MNESRQGHLWRRTSQVAAIVVFLLPLNAIAGGRPAVQQLQLDGSESLTELSVTAGGGVAQEGSAAAIYRSTGCGFQSWIGGQPAWLDQMIFFNDGGIGAPLRSRRSACSMRRWRC